jgi:hypothetical protein
MSANKWTKQEAWTERAEDVPGGEDVVERSKEFSYQIERARRMIEDDSIPWTAAEGH